VYLDFQLLDNALGLFPGKQELEDDLRDHLEQPATHTGAAASYSQAVGVI
jgi:hypothetical protein